MQGWAPAHEETGSLQNCSPLGSTDPTAFCLPFLPFQSGFSPHPLSGRCLEHSLHAQHVQPEIAGQDTRAVAALIAAPREKKGTCLGIRGREPFGLHVESLVREAWGLGTDCA